ncbi:MAG: hypothetical protein WA116_03050 [Anaerolineaceae bacterium]
MKRQPFLLILLVFIILFAGARSALSQTDPPTKIDLVSPIGCPISGCAAGQRLNFQLSFQVNPLFLIETNTKVCLTSTDGNSSTDLEPLFEFDGTSISPKGLISNVSYSQESCGIDLPVDEVEIVSVSSQHQIASADQLNLALRVSPDANLTGSLIVHVFEKDAGGLWKETGNAELEISTDPLPAQEAYVAKDSNTCGIYSPCYVNSADDLAGGVGTGLKDAVDALPDGTAAQASEITILGSYPIKSQEVLVDKAFVVLNGLTQSQITTESTTCSSGMIALTNQSTIDNLTINDGNCTSVSRNLIRVNSPKPVTVQNSTLKNGANAILYEDNSGDLLVRFNQIEMNSGYAIRRSGASGAGKLTAVANNIVNNGWTLLNNSQLSTFQVYCQDAAKGTIDHNYWGDGIFPDASSKCSYTSGAHLGAAILTKNAGVAGEVKQVTSTGTNFFNSAVTVKHLSDSDYLLYVVNHGQGSEDNVPFLNHGSELITPCSNHYDIFLDSSAAATDLVASFKYNLNTSCQNAIESSTYCGQNDPALYPLWWFDPKTGLTSKWDRVGETINKVSCNTSEKVITMTLQSTGPHPNLVADLNYTPFVVGLPLSEGTQLTESGLSASYQVNQVKLTWTSVSENNIGGFHIQRSLNLQGPFYRISPLIDSIGNPFTGGLYNYLDNNVELGKTYYYQLEVVNSSGLTVQLFGPVSISSATQTPTNTFTPTITLTPTPSNTFTITLTPTKTSTRTSTPTRTQYYYRSPTAINRTATPVLYRTATSSYRSPTPRISGTPTITRTGTPGIGVYPFPSGTPSITTSPLPGIVSPTMTGTTGDVTQTPTLSTTEAVTESWLDKSDRYEEGSLWGIPLGIAATGLCLLVTGWFVSKKR